MTIELHFQNQINQLTYCYASCVSFRLCRGTHSAVQNT